MTSPSSDRCEGPRLLQRVASAHWAIHHPIHDVFYPIHDVFSMRFVGEQCFLWDEMTGQWRPKTD
jgi:hypothetical protein